MSRVRSSSTRSAALEREITKLQKAMPASAAGVSLEELLDHVNALSGRLLPQGEGTDSRVSRVFTPRTFRYYQTLGCIDPPERRGRRALYGPRHFLQALVVRKLLWEGTRAEGVAKLVEGRSAGELKRMFVQGVEQVIRPASVAAPEDPVVGRPVVWRRVPLAPGIELHLSGERGRFKPAERKAVLERVEEALKA